MNVEVVLVMEVFAVGSFSVEREDLSDKLRPKKLTPKGQQSKKP